MGNHNGIYFTEINDSKSEWKEMSIKLTTELDCLDSLLVFDQIVMFIDTHRSIWFLDLYKETLIQSDHILPKKLCIDTLIKGEDDYLHAFDVGNEHHIKIDLFELIPQQFINIGRIEVLIS